MSQVLLDLPDKAALALKVPDEKLGAEIRMTASVKLYELGRLSSGAAAEFAGVPKPVWLSRLADYGVETFQLTEDDFAAEKRLV